MTTASVIIATYNRATLLDDCLRHLARNDFVPGDEVIVCDNGSTDTTAAVVAAHATGYPVPLRYVLESTPGKSHAVASGLALAGGDIVAFTDDDVNVEPGWLGALKAALAVPGIALAGGAVTPRWERSAPRWLRLHPDGYGRLAAPLGLLDYGPAPSPLGPRALLGANMAALRSVLAAHGGFATHLGKLRGTLLSGEDDELCRRIQAAGFGARYVPGARVAHWVPATRMRLWYFLGWFYWSGITHATIDAESAGGQPAVPLPYSYLLRQFATGLAGAATNALGGRLPRAVDRLLDSAFAAGYAARRLGLVAQVGQPAAVLARSV